MKITVFSIVTTVLVIIITIIAGIFWFIWNLNLNDYRQQISAMVNMQTGWQMELAGSIEHHAMPNGFWLSAHDVRIIDPRGQFIDIERLQAQVSLARILSGHIAVSGLEVAVRSCEVKLRPEVTPPIPIALDAEADAMHLTAQDCHVVDVESGLDTHIENLVLDVAPMPLLSEGWVVAGMPAGVLGAVQKGSVQASTVDFGDILGLKNLAVDFSNDRGWVSIVNMTAALQPPGATIFGPTSPQFTAKGRISLGFYETRRALYSTLWNGVDDVWLEPLSLSFNDLTIETPTVPVYAQNLRIDITAIPLLAKRKSLLTWLVNDLNAPKVPPHRTTISGTELSYAAWNLANYTITADLQPNRPSFAIERGTLSTIPTDDGYIKSLVLDLEGKVDLTISDLPANNKQKEAVANALIQQAVLSKLLLTIKQVELTGQNSEYRIATARLEIAELPLIQDGAVISQELAKALLSVAPMHPSASVYIENISHNEANIDSIMLDLVSNDSDIRLNRLEIAIADTKLTGTGDLKLNNPKFPWNLGITSPGGITVAPLLAVLDTPSIIQGIMDVNISLKSQGIQLDTLLSNLSGSIKVTGSDLKVISTDLDAIITRLEDSRGVGLLDLGAYILLGPAGIILTKGTQYSVLLGSVIAKGNSQIVAMSSALQVETGVVRTEDVALATKKHRLAMVGTMDLREEGPASLQIATVDKKGCAKYMETIGGTGRNPEVSGTGVVINSVLNPVKSVVSTLIGPVIGSCFIPFYQGQISAPP